MGQVIFGRRVLESATIDGRSRRAMSGLASLGIEEGDSVALLLRNDIAFLEASLAIGALGAYSVPINWHARPAEIEAVLADSGAKLVIAHADLASAIDARHRVLVVRTPREIIEAYALDREACRVPASALEWDPCLESQPCWSSAPRRPRGSIVYTSGTTGTPKGIQREPSAGATDERSFEQTVHVNFGIRPGLRSLVCGPLYHSMQTANMRAAYSALGPDGMLVIEPRFDPERLLATIELHRVTHILMVPIMFYRLLRLGEDVHRRYSLRSLEFVVHSAAPCPIEVKRGMIEWFGPVIHEFYAQSELGAVTLISSEESLRKPGSVGRALPGCTVKVLDELRKEVAAGERGEIAAVNHSYPDFTYRNCPEARRALDRGGLVATGDVGYIDKDGYLFLCGRNNDRVISGGVNIFPVEVEELLGACPGVADCAVFGIPDEEYGEVLAAHIQPEAGSDLSEPAVRAWLRERLPGFKLPKVIRFEASLPREESGKIFKRRIRERYPAS